MHAAGEVLGGRFELEALAGEGGMGSVYRALDRASGEPVALKLIREPNARAVARFARETEALSNLSHPHIVRYIAHGVTAAGEPYLAMEWLTGETLVERLARAPLTVSESVSVARLAAEALGVAHAHGIVHRDVKPSNLFLALGRVDEVRVLDFGLAWLGRASVALTKTGTLLGTPGYMAPEQVKGERVDARTDVFALGCVLFECLTGRAAFEGHHVLALLAKLVLEEAPRVRELRPELPEALDALVGRMLAKDPGERPEGGAEVAACLAALGVTEARSDTPSPRAREVITTGERRLVSVLAVQPRREHAATTDPTLLEPGTPSGELAELRRILVPLGARVEQLADGTLIGALVGAGSATDQAAAAARGALQARALLTDARVVLVTGRGEASVTLPVGEALERAAALLALGRLEVERRRPVRVDEVTRALLDMRFEVTEEDGRLLLWQERAISRTTRTLLGKQTPFVGRERDLATLERLIEESFEEGRASVALVTGAAGMGKSRLRHEVVSLVQKRFPRFAIGIGRGEAIGAGSAFALLGGLFRSALGIEAGEPAEAQRKKLAFMLDRFLEGDARPRAMEFLGELAGLPPPVEESPRLRAARQNAAIMTEQIGSALIDFWRSITREMPGLLVLEDLHWGDMPSVRLIGAALRDLRDAPFVVLAFARPEVERVFPQLWEDRGMTTIRLVPMSRRASEQLVRSALGDAIAADTVAALVERAGGNAFYLEELIRAVAEGRGGALPETVLGMVEARLSALAPEARRLLRAGSIFGGTFWRDGVLALLAEPTSSAAPHRLAELEAMEVIRRRLEPRFAGQEEYGFRHALVREGAYAMLTERDRELGHKRAAEWLVAVGDPDPMVIAEHFERGKEGRRAAEFYARAAAQASLGGDYDALTRMAAAGLAGGAEGETAATLHALEARARIMTGDYRKSYESATMALALAAPGSPSYGSALNVALSATIFVGDLEGLRALMPSMLTLEPRREALAPIASAFRALVLTLLLRDGSRVAEAYARRMGQVVMSAGGSDVLAVAWGELSSSDWALAVEHDPGKALALAQASVEHFEEAGFRSICRYAQEQSCLYRIMLGDHRGAAEVLASLHAKGGGEGITLHFHRYLSALTCLLAGRLGEARMAASALWKEMRPAKEHILGPWACLVAIESALLEGDLGAAERDAAELAESGELPPNARSSLLALQAELRLRQGRASEAVELASAARGLHEAFDALLHPGQEAIPLVYAEALHAVGDIEGARVAIEKARGALLARAARIPDPAARQGFLENIPARARTLALARSWLGEPPVTAPEGA